jgi:regulator of RNase E activity RraA
MVGDADGVIVMPQDRVAEVAAKMRVWSDSETEARKAIADGMPLLKALAKYGHL